MGSKRKTHHSENHYPSALCSWPGLPLSFAVLERSLGVSRVERMLIVQMLYRFQIPPTFMNNDCHIPSAATTSLEPAFDCDPSIELVDVSSVVDEIEFSWSIPAMIVESFASWSAEIWLTWHDPLYTSSAVSDRWTITMEGGKDAFALVSTSCCTCPSEKKKPAANSATWTEVTEQYNGCRKYLASNRHCWYDDNKKSPLICEWVNT